MDPLSDVLRVVRLTGAHFFPASASGPWAIEAPPAKELSPRILPESSHLISYHMVLSGSCWGGVTGRPPVALERGDLILFAHGHGHVMGGGAITGRRPMPVHAVPRFPTGTVFGDRARPDVTLICGFFGCDREPFNPLCAALPDQVVLRGMSGGIAGVFAQQVEEEANSRRAGADSMLTRLAELMFIEVLRRYLDSLSEGGDGWLAGVRDPIVGRALSLIHEQPGRSWTLADLAAEAAASRSNLAERFTQLVGIPPMQYLTNWRIQVASNLLRESGAKVTAVAAAVGYESEAAFSRAFKKATGVAPGRWRVQAGSDN